MYSVNLNSDLYPTRGTAEKILKRKSPVIFNDPEKLSKKDARRLVEFDQKGYIILHDVFDEKELAEIKKELELLKDTTTHENFVYEKGSDKLRSIFGIHYLSPFFSKFALDERITSVVKNILADELYIHQSRVNFKPGLEGNSFFWHSDFETWHAEDGMPDTRCLSASVFLNDNNEFNGPLMVLEGSHKYFLSCAGQTPDDHYLKSLKEQKFGTPSKEQLKVISDHCEISSTKARAGSVLLFDCNLIHGSGGNLSPFPRSNLFFVYNAISNKVREPFAADKPRPEFIATRENMKVLDLS